MTGLSVGWTEEKIVPFEKELGYLKLHFPDAYRSAGTGERAV